LAAQALVAVLITSLAVVVGPSAQAQGRCEPYVPYKKGSIAGVQIPNYCGSVPTNGRLQRHRWFGWQILDSVDVSPGGLRTASWNCAGVGTYTYRGINSLGTYLFIGDEKRFGC
jgi:hypothetical protein